MLGGGWGGGDTGQDPVGNSLCGRAQRGLRTIDRSTLSPFQVTTCNSDNMGHSVKERGKCERSAVCSIIDSLPSSSPIGFGLLYGRERLWVSFLIREGVRVGFSSRCGLARCCRIRSAVSCVAGKGGGLSTKDCKSNVFDVLSVSASIGVVGD